MITVQEYRDYVRAYFDSDVEEMPDRLIDPWIRKGFTAIARRLNHWSFYEEQRTLVTSPTVAAYDVAPVVTVERIVGPRGPIGRIDHSMAEARYNAWTPVTGPVDAYSMWKGKVYLWPVPTSSETYVVRGYRAAASVLGGGAAATPDLPEDFHDVLLDFVMAQAHLYQEDTELAQARMQQFTSGLEELLKADTEMPEDGPIVIGGGMRDAGLVRPRLPWE